MATEQLNAPTSGVIHVRTRLTENFTILSNRLAQRPGSAVTVGVALFITSKPDGTPITIEALREHFSEGETLLGRALNELEDEGWLERRIVRARNGRLATRTYVYTVPNQQPEHDATPLPAVSPAPPATPGQPRVAAPARVPGPRPAAPAVRTPGPAPVRPLGPTSPPAPTTSTFTEPEPTQPPPATAPSLPLQPQTGPTTGTETDGPPPASTEARTLLTQLAAQDPRLLLTPQEATRLAPAVDAWLTKGIPAAEITRILSSDLPTSIRTRPAHLLGWRLRELTPTPPAPATPRPDPLQNCDNCDRAHRSPHPGLCRSCRQSVPT